jgi:hypothetical protein
VDGASTTFCPLCISSIDSIIEREEKMDEVLSKKRVINVVELIAHAIISAETAEKMMFFDGNENTTENNLQLAIARAQISQAMNAAGFHQVDITPYEKKVTDPDNY